jgi:CarboxypepD_reg-like domain/TonB-dependent Receptor Plug Domain
MRRILIIFLATVFSSILSGQEEILLNKTYPDLPLVSFFQNLEQEEDLQFIFQSGSIDSLRSRALPAGTSLTDALASVLQESGLSFYVNQGKVFIFEGEELITEFPQFDAKAESESNLAALRGEQGRGEEQFLITKGLPDKRNFVIGSREHAVRGRNYMVRGHISNSENGEALIGATIYVKETSSGTISDIDGNFELKLSPRNYNIVVNHMAMKETEYGLTVLSDGSMNIELDENLIELEEITVTDDRRSNVKGMFMGYERISVKSMKEVPVVMGEKDVLKIVQLLPGVQNAGEGSAGFNVRGGSSDQNMFYINKISIYNTSHLFGFFTSFSPDIVSDFSLYKNNVPAKYGGRIASIFNISTRQGNKNHFFAQGGISPVTAHISVEGPVVKEKVSVVASARSTYSDWILGRMNDYDLQNSSASFNDFTLGLDAKLNPDNQVNLFLYRSSDSFSLYDKNEYKYSNNGASLSWYHNFSKTFSSEFSLSSSEYKFSTIDMNSASEAYSHEYALRHTEVRADLLSFRLDGHRIEFGGNAILYKLNRGDILPYGLESLRIPVELGEEQGIEHGYYISDEFELFPRLDLLLGLRYGLYSQLGPAEINQYEDEQARDKYSYLETISYKKGSNVKTYSGLEPRAAINYKLAQNSSIKASYSRLQQFIFLLSNTIAIAPNDQWKLADYHISPAVADQVSLGYYQDVRDPNLNLSVEVYKKWVNGLLEYKDGADFISADAIETQVLQGFQDSRGVEFMLRKNDDRLTGWLSYAYSRSTVIVDGEHDEEKINGGNSYPSNFDKPHSMNLVANYRLSKRLSLSSNVVYSTGRPVTLPVASYYAEGRPYLLQSSRNAYRIPNYFRIDFSVNLEGNLKKNKFAHSFWMLNIYNLTGRENAYSVYYEVQDEQVKGYKLSIFARPIVTISWNFKLGNFNSN